MESFVKNQILLLSMDTLNWLKVTVKTFIMQQKYFYFK